jgi:hypothetical protein
MIKNETGGNPLDWLSRTVSGLNHFAPSLLGVFASKRNSCQIVKFMASS